MVEIKLFNRWDTLEINVADPGLKRYINLTPVLAPHTQGRNTKKQFWKSKKPIVERLINRLFVTGHKSKKHWRSSGGFTGKKQNAYNIVKESFEIIECRTKKNPVQVFVEAIDKSAPTTGISTIEYGGVRYPKAMDLSPQRRIDLVLRWMTQGAYGVAAGSKSKKSMAEALSEEIIATAAGDTQKSSTMAKKVDLERQAEASR